MKILIIDDSLMDRKLLINALKRANIDNEVLQASNGEDGLRILNENSFDVCIVLLDWQMPKMDGIQFMKQTQRVSHLQRIPIVMVSASGSDKNKRYAKEVNPDLAGYVVKPYTPSLLIDTIKHLIL